MAHSSADTGCDRRGSGLLCGDKDKIFRSRIDADFMAKKNKNATGPMVFVRTLYQITLSGSVV
jgi:hypothetical protein